MGLEVGPQRGPGASAPGFLGFSQAGAETGCLEADVAPIARSFMDGRGGERPTGFCEMPFTSTRTPAHLLGRPRRGKAGKHTVLVVDIRKAASSCDGHVRRRSFHRCETLLRRQGKRPPATQRRAAAALDTVADGHAAAAGIQSRRSNATTLNLAVPPDASGISGATVLSETERSPVPAWCGGGTCALPGTWSPEGGPTLPPLPCWTPSFMMKSCRYD